MPNMPTVTYDPPTDTYRTSCAESRPTHAILRDSGYPHDAWTVPVVEEKQMTTLRSLDPRLQRYFSRSKGPAIRAQPIVILQDVDHVVKANDTPTRQDVVLQSVKTVTPMAFWYPTTTATKSAASLPVCDPPGLRDDENLHLQNAKSLRDHKKSLKSVADSLKPSDDDWNTTWQRVGGLSKETSSWLINSWNPLDAGPEDSFRTLHEKFLGVEGSSLAFTGKGQFGRYTLPPKMRAETGIDWVAVAPVLRDVKSGQSLQYDEGALVTVKTSSPMGPEDVESSTERLGLGYIVERAVNQMFSREDHPEDTAMDLLEEYNSVDPTEQQRLRKGLLRRLTTLLSREVMLSGGPGWVEIPVGEEESVVR